MHKLIRSSELLMSCLFSFIPSLPPVDISPLHTLPSYLSFSPSGAHLSVCESVWPSSCPGCGGKWWHWEIFLPLCGVSNSQRSFCRHGLCQSPPSFLIPSCFHHGFPLWFSRSAHSQTHTVLKELLMCPWDLLGPICDLTQEFLQTRVLSFFANSANQ